MDKYIIDGQELDYDEFKAYIKEKYNYDSAEDYLATYDVEVVKPKDVADPDATAASKKPASLDSQLEASNSRYAELTKEIDTKFNFEKNKTNHNKAIGAVNSLVNDKRKEYQKIEELETQITTRNLDPDQFKQLTVEDVIANPDRMINQKQDNVVNWLKGNFPYLDIKASGVGAGNLNVSNNVTIDTGNGVKEIDLEDFFQNFNKKKKQEIVDVLKELNASKKIKTDKEIIGINVRNLGKSVENSGTETANAYLKSSTPFEIQQVVSDISADARTDAAPDITYNVLKDGEVVANMPSTDLDDFFQKNITEEGFEKLANRSFNAAATVSSLVRARQLQLTNTYKEDPNTKKDYFKSNFAKDLVDKMKANKVSAADIEKVEDYLKQQVETNTTQLASMGPASQYGITEGSVDYDTVIKAYSTLEGLDPELKNRLINAGINNESLTELTGGGVDKFILNKVNRGEQTIIDRIYSGTNKGELLDLVNIFNKKIAGTTRNEKTGDITEVAKVDVENLDLDGDIAEQLSLGDSFMDTKVLLGDRNITKVIIEQSALVEKTYNDLTNPVIEKGKSILKTLPKGVYTVTKETPTGPLIELKADRELTEDEQDAMSSASIGLTSVQSALHNINNDYTIAKDRLKNDMNQYITSRKKYTQYDNLINEANKERGLFNLVGKDVGDAFSTMALALPTLFDSEWAIGKQKQINDKDNYYKTMTDPEFSAEYIFRTFGQQSANLTLAIATGGIASTSAIGLQAAGISNVIGVGFGLTSGTQTFRDLNIEVDVYDEALKQRDIYTKAYNAQPPGISEFNYERAMLDINKTLAMGRLTDSQIMTAAFANGTIEGVFTKFLGTAPNTIALLKNFSTVNRKLIAEQLFAGNLSKVASFIGTPLAAQTGFEVLEELSIFAGQEFITNAGILDRKIDPEQFKKGVNDTFWATIVTAGGTQGSGIAYSGLNAYSITNKYEKQINEAQFNINGLSKTLAGKTFANLDANVQSSLLESIANEMKDMGLAVDQNAVDMLNLGATEINKLIGTQLIKRDFLISEGISNFLSIAQTEEAVAAKRKTMTANEVKEFDTVIASLDKQINNIKEAAGKQSNYDTAKSSLGDLYTTYDATLQDDKEYTSKSQKDKLVYIVNKARADFEIANIESAKADPDVKNWVEGLRVNKAGQIVNDKRAKGLLTDKQKELKYKEYGRSQGLQMGRGFSNQIQVERNAQQILGKDLKNINVKEWTDDAAGKLLLKEAGLKPGSKEYTGALDALRNKKTFGLVFGKTILTQNVDDMNADLKAGKIRAGTVVLHELNHIIDDARMKTPESKEKYFNNLFSAASTTTNQALNILHNQTVRALNNLYGKKGIKNKIKWEDEYTKHLQEQLYAYEDKVLIEKDDNFLTKMFDFTDPSNLNTPKKALDYLAASNSAFRKGKLSAASVKAVNKFTSKDLKFSGNVPVKNINKLVIGKTYDQLKNDPEFRRQYDNVAVKAMKFDQELGNEINRKTVLGEAYVQLPSIIKNYKPVNEKGESQTFTNYVYQTLDPQKRTAAFYRKELGEIPTQKIGKMQLLGNEDADANIKREAREKLEGKGKSLIKTTELRGVENKLTEVDEAIGDIDQIEFVNLLDSRSGELDFAKINEEYGSKVAGALYGLNPKDAINLTEKFKKGADLTYGQNKFEKRSKLASEAERIQSDYTSIEDAKNLISLFPEYNISTPTAVTSKTGQETKTSELVQGRSLGTSPAVLGFFYETYIDPKSLNKKTKKDAITNPSGRSKGKTSQVNVVRLKPEFNYKAGTITNAAVVRAQRKIGITKSGELNIPPKGKARTEFGRLLIGLANLKGAIVANTAVDTKVKKGIKDGTIKTAKSALQIEADLKAGRSKIQFSLKEAANRSFNVDKNGNPLFIASNIKLTRPGIFTERGLKYKPNKKIAPWIKDKKYFSKLKIVSEKAIKQEKKKWEAKEKARLEQALKKEYLTINRNEVLPDNATNIEGETVFNGLVRVVNNFLDINPEWNNAIRYSTTNSAERNTFISNPVYQENIQPARGTQKGGRLPLLTNKQYNKGTKYDDSFEIRFKSDGYLKDAEQKIDDLKSFGLAMQNYLKIKGNEKDAWVFAAIAKDGQNNQNSIFRYSAPQLFAAIDSNGNFSIRPMIEEHSMPQNNIGTSLVDSAIKGRIEEDFPVLKASFMQGALTYDDNNLVDVDYKFKMPEIYWNQVVPLLMNGELKLPMGLASMIRYTESGVDLNGIVYKTKINGAEAVVNLGDYFFGNQVTPVALQKELIKDYFTGKISKTDVKKKAKFSTKVTETINKTFKPNAAVVIAKNNKADKAMADARNSVKYKESRKGISVFDFDDTLAQSNSNVLYTMPDGTTGSLTAGEFALEASYLGKNGAKFDFSEFNEVKEGKKGPLADVALKRQGKFGSKDIFVLTARPQASAINIKKFLDEIGLNIPLENITGLENGTAEAKAEWMIGKYADGYNDFYFADDAFKNVEAVRNVFDVLDVKSDVQQARVKFSEKLDKDFNDMIERNMGVKSEYTYSDILARRKGRNQKRFAFFIPPSADDFRGLTMYTFAGKGKQGELDQEFFDKALIKPYMSGINAMELAKNKIKNAYKILEKTSPKVRKKLKKKIGDTKYTNDEAIRIYLWNQDGAIIPGLSKTDQNKIVKLVEADVDLMAFAEGVKLITEKDTYVPPNEYWDGTTIIGDLSRLSKEINRDEYLKEFKDNADILFTDKNMNKIEAVYGFRVREALENSLYRMKTGSNKAAGSGRIVTAWNNWVNNSVGAIMFFNRRSALLQMLSAGNFVNWSDNNPLKAGLAFANAPQYWKDVVYLFNSPKLKARRQGLEGDIQEKEIAEASRRGGMEGALSYLLKIGFTPTQIADSIAISTGGASFYRNRINTYKKEGYTVEDAEKKAFDDFSAISDETQQSADPMLISSQQAGVLGRLVLSFQNTPMQYTRLMKKAGQDLINRRGDPKTNISKILYYGFIQNLIFSTLQNAMFALVPGFEDDEEEPDFKTDKERDAWLKKQGGQESAKITRVANNMLDTILRGSGLAGAVVSTIKNVIIEYTDRQDMGILAKSRANADLLIALTSISPPISSKIRKVNKALDLEDFEKDVIAERGYSVTIDGKFQLSPSYNVIGNVASATLNLPLDRVFDEVNSITEALDDRNSAYQRLALGLGWKTWDVNAKIEEHDLIKTNAKAKRKIEGKEKSKQTRKDNKEILQTHRRLRAQVLNALPDVMRDSITRKEREDNKITAIYKLNQLKAKYVE